MASPVEIANVALALLGEEPITSLDDETVAARTIDAGFDLIRDRELAAHPWKFAIKRAALPALADAPEWGFARNFAAPSDMLRLLEIEGQWLALPFEADPLYALEQTTDGNVISGDFSAPLNIRYIARITDTERFAPSFAWALACALADYACEKITQSNAKSQSLMARHREALAQARRIGALEAPARGIQEGYFDRSRA